MLSIKTKKIRMVSDVKLRRAFYRVKVRSVRARAIIEALQTLNLPIQLTRHTRSRDIMLFTCSSIKRNLHVLGRIFALPYYVLLQRIYQRIRCTLIIHTLHTHSHVPAHSLKPLYLYNNDRYNRVHHKLELIPFPLEILLCLVIHGQEYCAHCGELVAKNRDDEYPLIFS